MDLLGSLAGGSLPQGQSPQEGEFLKCSRKGCTEPAAYRVLWNNPKIHTPERRKIWLACAEHRGYLQDFLVARDFWKATEPLEADNSSTLP